MLPGAPLLPATIVLIETALLTADLLSLAAIDQVPQWGIYLDGAPVVVAENVVTFDYQKEARISDYQVEQGGFESYNKVEQPYQAMVRFSAGASESARQELLESIREAAKTLDLYDVVTPEAVYLSGNIVVQSYRRGAHNGVGLLQVDVRVEEVRVAGTSNFTTTKSPAGQNPVGVGNVSPTDATPAQEAKVPQVQ